MQIAQHTEKLETERRNQANIDAVKGQLAAAQTAQDNNTKRFLAEFQSLSEKLRALEVNAATEEDRAEIVTLNAQLKSAEAELRKTQKAMAPTPKAKIDFTFFPFVNPLFHEGQPVPPVQLVKDVNLPISADDIVHVDFTVVNLSETGAHNLGVTLVICELCKFAKEPQGFQFVSGSNHQTERTIYIPELHALEAFNVTVHTVHRLSNHANSG